MDTPRILLIDKPSGITSFDCIRILRKKLGIRNPSTGLRVKMGHAGTLDPMATGLMIIGVEEGTKKLQDFLKLPKTYEAEILLGVRTDTGDVTGRVLEESKVNGHLSDVSKLSEVLNGMVGKLELPVPAYSAIKRGGEALYKKARRGEVVDVPIKTMEVKSVEFLGLGILPLKKGGDPQDEGFPPLRSSEGNEGWLVSARFDVSSGTYIRSLAEELGRRLARTNFAEQNLRVRGVPATLAGLRRTRIGEFKVEDAQKIDL